MCLSEIKRFALIRYPVAKSIETWYASMTMHDLADHLKKLAIL